MTEMRIKKNDMPVSDVEMGETHGTGTFITWSKLNEMLRKAGTLNPNEYVKGVNINAAGFGIYIGSNADPESDLYEKPLGD